MDDGDDDGEDDGGGSSFASRRLSPSRERVPLAPTAIDCASPPIIMLLLLLLLLLPLLLRFSTPNVVVVLVRFEHRDANLG
jgi:hypothetical protein